MTTEAKTTVAATDALTSAVDWAKAGHKVALATVIWTSGSSPRPAGSQLAIRGDLRLVGSVSAGCVETQVIRAAQQTLETGEATLLEFGVASDTNVFAAGLVCGGRIEVLVESITEHVDLLGQLVDDRHHRRPVCVVHELPSGQRKRVQPGMPQAGALGEAIAGAFRSGNASTVEHEGSRWFVQPYGQPRRMVIVGAVHIAQALVPMASACGYHVIVVDPRTTFASAERFPGAELITRWPDAALAELELDARTAVVVLTHDRKLDDPALTAALERDCFYVGALGSTRTQTKRLARLREAGIAADTLERISGPVGLAIGAKSPAEIAISIMAEVTQRSHGA